MRIYRLFTIALAASFCLGAASIQAQTRQSAGSTSEAAPADVSRAINISTMLARTGTTRRRGFSLQPGSSEASSVGINLLAAGPSLPVMGNGTVGRLTKWSGFSSSSSSIGDTTIYEDKFGKVGIGTDAPASKLTVAGVIESTGGFKFPDGTVQMSAGVVHDATLSGNGTQAAPLSAAPLIAAITGEPFQQEFVIPVPNNALTGAVTFVVGNKLLVIEFVSAACSLFSPGFLIDDFEISTTVSGQTATYRFAAIRTVPAGGIDHYVATQQVVIRADPGSTVTMGVRFPSQLSSGATGRFTLSGRLFDVP